MSKDKLTAAQFDLIADLAWPDAVVKGDWGKYISSPYHHNEYSGARHSASTFNALIKRGYLVQPEQPDGSRPKSLIYVLSLDGIQSFNEYAAAHYTVTPYGTFDDKVKRNKAWWDEMKVKKEAAIEAKEERKEEILELIEDLEGFRITRHDERVSSWTMSNSSDIIAGLKLLLKEIK